MHKINPFPASQHHYYIPPKRMTYIAVGIATALLLGGAAVFPVSPIIGASLILGGAVLATALLVKALWKKYQCPGSDSKSAASGDELEKLHHEICDYTAEAERSNCIQAIREFFQTEILFFYAINLFVQKNWMISPLDGNGTFFDKLQSEGLLTEKRKQSLQKDILEIHQSRLEFFFKLGLSQERNFDELSKRLSDLSFEEALKVYLHHFSPVNMQQNFQSCVVFMKHYNEHLKWLTKALETSEKGKTIREKFRKKNGKDVFAFFIEPAQRIPRYPLLWADFIKLYENKTTPALSMLMHQRLEGFVALTEKVNRAI